MNLEYTAEFRELIHIGLTFHSDAMAGMQRKIKGVKMEGERLLTLRNKRMLIPLTST